MKWIKTVIKCANQSTLDDKWYVGSTVTDAMSSKSDLFTLAQTHKYIFNIKILKPMDVFSIKM